MIGTHAVFQTHCPICIGEFKIDDVIVMRVVEHGVQAGTQKKIGVIVEYLHDHCAPTQT